MPLSLRCVVLFVCLVAAPVFGQETAPAASEGAQFQRDPVEHYTTQILTGLIVVGAALVLYSLLRYRGRTQGFASWALLLTGVMVLPVFTGMVGTVLVFEKAEQVQFCASCHLTMKPYIDDMTGKESPSLAAIHYKNRYIPANQCYECHTSYGMHGTVGAKMSGMIDTYKYYTGTYELPIKMRHPYPNDDCLKCHADSKKWQEQDLHKDNKDALFKNEMKCMDCHADMTGPAHVILPQTAAYEKH